MGTITFEGPPHLPGTPGAPYVEGVTVVMTAQGGVTVHAVEPSPATFSSLDLTVSANDLQGRIKPVSIGSGASEGELAFFGNQTSGSASHLVTELAERRSSTVEVPMSTVERYIETHDVHWLDVLKIDVEGFEIDVLAGATRAIERLRPAVFVGFDSFAMVMIRDISPRQLFERIRSAFPYPYRWTGVLQRMGSEGDADELLHDHLAGADCVDDLHGSLRPFRSV